MPISNPDRAGYLEAAVAEIKSLRDMGTWDLEEVLDEEQMRTAKIGMSRCVITMPQRWHLRQVQVSDGLSG